MRSQLAHLGYVPISGWPHVPHGLSFGGDATSVATTADGGVIVFGRGPVPLLMFEASGAFLSATGEGEFDRPHSVVVDAADNIYLVDAGGHFVQKRTQDGKILLTLGDRGTAVAAHSGDYFNQPTDIAIHPITGEMYISDGYGNSRIHRFDADGKHIASWGAPGSGPGEFSLPHGICLLDDDRIAVCDRENYRIQIFTSDGEFDTQWHCHRPCSVRTLRGSGLLFVAELGNPLQHTVPRTGSAVSVFDPGGKAVGRIGDSLPGMTPTGFTAPHGLAIDPAGDLYVAEVSYTYVTKLLGLDAPAGELVSLRKWTGASGR
jgi:DNA-binding beta-propeller fold protein YncE